MSAPRRLALVAGLVCSMLVLACEGGPPETLPGPPSATTPAGTATSAPANYEDAFSYCAQAGTVDEPGPPYAGDQYPTDVFTGLLDEMHLPEDAPARSVESPEFSWRCHDGFVYACTYGANLPCDQADLSDRPTQEMVDFCSSQYDGVPLPGSLTGHDTIYGWVCRGDTPATTYQKYEVDDRGFVSSFWHWIPAPTSDASPDATEATTATSTPASAAIPRATP